MAETADSSFMSPELVSLFVQMGPTLYQGLLGRNQGQEAEKLRNSTVRPTMGIQEGYKKAFGMAQQNAGSRYMSNQRAIEQGIEQSGADLLGTASQSATSTGDMQAILKKVSEDITKAKGNLGIQAASDYDRRQLALQQAYQTMGGLEQNAWDYNTRQKYDDDAAAAAALQTASYTNKARALQGFGQAAGQFLASDAADNLFNRIGKSQTAPVPSDQVNVTRADVNPPTISTPSTPYQRKLGLADNPFDAYVPPTYSSNQVVTGPSTSVAPGFQSKLGLLDDMDYTPPVTAPGAGMATGQSKAADLLNELQGVKDPSFDAPNYVGTLSQRQWLTQELQSNDPTRVNNAMYKMDQWMVGSGGQQNTIQPPISGQQQMTNLINNIGTGQGQLAPGMYNGAATILGQNTSANAAMGQQPSKSSVNDLLNLIMFNQGVNPY